MRSGEQNTNINCWNTTTVGNGNISFHQEAKYDPMDESLKKYNSM